MLQVAKDYCMCHDDCELILIDVFWTKGSVFTDTNQFAACYESFQAEYNWLQKALSRDPIELPNIREVFALGGLENGLQSLNGYEKAEHWYRSAFQAWENVPGDRKIYVGSYLGQISKITDHRVRQLTCAPACGYKISLTRPSDHSLALSQTGMTHQALGRVEFSFKLISN